MALQPSSNTAHIPGSVRMLIRSSRIGAEGIAVSLETSLSFGPRLESSEISAHFGFSLGVGGGGHDLALSLAICLAFACSLNCSLRSFWEGPLNMNAVLTVVSDEVDPPGAASGDDDIMVSAILCR